jgi:hypothetical protein
MLPSPHSLFILLCRTSRRGHCTVSSQSLQERAALSLSLPFFKMQIWSLWTDFPSTDRRGWVWGHRKWCAKAKPDWPSCTEEIGPVRQKPSTAEEQVTVWGHGKVLREGLDSLHNSSKGRRWQRKDDKQFCHTELKTGSWERLGLFFLR